MHNFKKRNKQYKVKTQKQNNHKKKKQNKKTTNVTKVKNKIEVKKVA
jgi:hypothetical protein